jgi:hypothetical protein
VQAVMPSGTSASNEELVVKLLTMHIAQLANIVDVKGKRDRVAHVATDAACFEFEANMMNRTHREVKLLLGALQAAGNILPRETDDSRRSESSSSSLDCERFLQNTVQSIQS